MNINLKHLYLLYTTFLSKILLFLKNILKIKSPSVKYQRAGNVRLPLVDGFRTFCWGEIVEELRKINKLKDLINIPASTMNPV
jgi:hypothetical protein